MLDRTIVGYPWKYHFCRNCDNTPAYRRWAKKARHHFVRRDESRLINMEREDNELSTPVLRPGLHLVAAGIDESGYWERYG